MRAVGDHDDGATEIVVALSLDELVAMANMVGETLEAVEDWEFHTRVGIDPDQARGLRDAIAHVLRATASPF